jgi:hypothetical protein
MPTLLTRVSASHASLAQGASPYRPVASQFLHSLAKEIFGCPPAPKNAAADFLWARERVQYRWEHHWGLNNGSRRPLERTGFANRARRISSSTAVQGPRRMRGSPRLATTRPAKTFSLDKSRANEKAEHLGRPTPSRSRRSIRQTADEHQRDDGDQQAYLHMGRPKCP